MGRLQNKLQSLLKEEPTLPNNVVTTCFVLFYEEGFVSCDTTIFLRRPTEEEAGQMQVLQFATVFAAKNFIQSHVIPGTFISVAA